MSLKFIFDSMQVLQMPSTLILEVVIAGHVFVKGSTAGEFGC